VRVGVHAGVVRFTVTLNPPARRALDRHKQLVLTVSLTLVSPDGTRASVIRRVVLHAGT
jgi:hypothetical protein